MACCVKHVSDRVDVDLSTYFLSRRVEKANLRRTLSPKSKLSSEPRDMIPWKQYTVSGMPYSVLNSVSTALGSVRSAFEVMTCFPPFGCFGSTMSHRMR